MGSPQNDLYPLLVLMAIIVVVVLFVADVFSRFQ